MNKNEDSTNSMEISSKWSYRIEHNSKCADNSSKNNAPNPSDINNIIKNIVKKEGE